jgi:hypothetical protein
MMLKSLKKNLTNVPTAYETNPNSSLSNLSRSLLKRHGELITQLTGGEHPQSLGAKKIRCLPNLYRMRMGRGYRMLIGFNGEEWISLGLYSRQYFTTLINRRRR